MATPQPLRGTPSKIYEVITNFNKGIDKKTADDVSLDSSFENLINFYNAAEGYLSKRPGVYNSNISKFVERLATGDFDANKYRIKTNRFGDTAEVLANKLSDFYSVVFQGNKKIGSEVEGTKFTFIADKVLGFQLLKNTFFLEAMQDYENILDGKFSNIASSNIIEFSFIMVMGGYYTSIKDGVESEQKHGLYVCRLSTKLSYEAAGYYDVDLELDAVDATMNPFKDVNNNYKCRWDYKPDGYTEGEKTIQPANTLDISNYNGYSYIATGSNYLIRVDQTPEVRVPSKIGETNNAYIDENSIIVQLGGYNQDNLYRPTSIELNQVGFNILANDPLSFYNVAGQANKIRGVYYSVDVTKNGQKVKQPVIEIPFNDVFYVHVLYTGTSKPDNIQYRPDNGETDTEKNPYKALPGAWTDDTKTIWKCDGINSNQKFELFIKRGDDEFRTFVTTTSSQIDETGYIDTISKLVFSSTHSKIINNQLVLYGGHGYMFFSEYDMFNYYPNYYYLYIANEAGEEAVTGVTYFRQYYAIFTNKRIKRMAGTFGADNFGIYPLSDFIGCPNGRTIKSVGNNLLFLGNDGIYKLKQGYLGEGTENVEKVDVVLNNTLNLTNVIQAVVMNNNYIVIKNDGMSWMVYNTTTDAFYEYNLESVNPMVYEKSNLDRDIAKYTLPFYSVFQTSLYDSHGDFLLVPMYKYNYSDDYKNVSKGGMDVMLFRFDTLDFLNENEKHKDGYGFISSLETHAMNMGYPTHTKKFKELYIKMINNSGNAIPLYVTIIVDDTVVLDPSTYVIKYNKENDTYYYVENIDSNAEIDVSKVLGEFTLNKDNLGEKTIQQIKIKIRQKGRSLKLKLSDGFDDYTNLIIEDEDNRGFPIRNRNLYDFSISTIGIVYKLKKVKEG